MLDTTLFVDSRRVTMDVSHFTAFRDTFLIPQRGMPWPQTIPYDLKNALAETWTPEQRIHELRIWAKTHGLKLKIGWYRGLNRDFAELHR